MKEFVNSYKKVNRTVELTLKFKVTALKVKNKH